MVLGLFPDLWFYFLAYFQCNFLWYPFEPLLWFPVSCLLSSIMIFFSPSVSYSSLHLTLTSESGSHGEVVVINPQQLLGLCTPLFGYIRTPFRHGTGSLGKPPLEGILLHKHTHIGSKHQRCRIKGVTFRSSSETVDADRNKTSNKCCITFPNSLSWWVVAYCHCIEFMQHSKSNNLMNIPVLEDKNGLYRA